MLTSKQLALAETLAIKVECDVESKVSPVIGALNSSLGTVIPVTPDNYMKELPGVAASSPEYTVIAEEVATIMAENARNAFKQIGLYGKGVSAEICNAINKKDAFINNPQSMVKDFLTSYLTIDFVRTDHPFFSSLLYPTKTKPIGINLGAVQDSLLDKVKFAYWEPAKIIEWLGIDNPEIKEVLMNPDVNLGRELQALGQSYNLNFGYDNDRKTVDFNKPWLSCCNSIFAQYIILSKMISEDAPFEGLTGGSLEDYRNHVRLLHTAYTHALIELKKQANGLSMTPIRMVELTEITNRDASILEGSRTYPVLHGKVVVYYTSAGMDLCIAGKINFTDVVIGYLYQKYNNLEPKIAYSYLSVNPNLNEYLENLNYSVIAIIRDMTAAIYKDAISTAVRDFVITRPELLEVVGETPAEVAKFVDKVMKEGEWGTTLYYQVTEYKHCLSDAVFGTGIISEFLKAIGCKDAASILRRTIDLAHHEDSEVNKRENLHVALIEHFTEKLFTRG